MPFDKDFYVPIIEEKKERGEYMLILKSISKKYNGSKKEVLKNINLAFDSTGLVTILGSSGSGKSTLLNLIGLIDKPTSGSIYLNGKDITYIKNQELDYYHHHYIGFIYQNYNLINSMNVEDNINLFSNNKLNILKSLGIGKYKRVKVNKLSGGEQQRVSIARAIINDPSIILCDEPTGALDSHNGIEIMKILKRLSKKKLVIMVTHDENLAMLYSDRIIRLKDGKIIDDTRPTFIRNEQVTYYKGKFKIKIRKILKIVFNNIRIKYKRNILIIFAFTIGLLALSCVLGISNGFTKSLDNAEKESLSEYPIYISETSTDAIEELDGIFENKKRSEEYIYSIKTINKNIIDDKLINLTDSIDSKYKIFNYITKDNKIITNVSNNYLDNVKLLKGKKTIDDKEALIMLDHNNTIDASILVMFDLNKDQYELDELLNRNIKINNKNYLIVGIVKNYEDSVMSDNSGIILNKRIGSPYSISIYPKDYSNKKTIITTLKTKSDVKFTDYASSIKSLSKMIMNGISTILIVFSLISLIVSTIMISIVTMISIMERTKEIGIYKSLGASNRYIKEIFIIENIILALISSLISIAIEVAISMPVNKLIYDLTDLSNVMVLSNNNILIIFVLAIFFSLVGSFIPLHRINRINIIDSLKNV